MLRPMRAAPLGLILLSAAVARADDPLAAAQKAWDEKRFADSRDLAAKAAAAASEKDRARAWRLAGVASCSMKDRPGALEATAHLPTKDHEMIQFACHQAGVEVTEEDAAIFASPARAEVEVARAAYAGGKYGEAKRLAAKIIERDAKLATGWRLFGASACWTRDKVNAQKARDHLQPADQELLRVTCARALGGGGKARGGHGVVQ